MNETISTPPTPVSPRFGGYFDRLLKRSTGWIGVDVGCVATKLAQLKRTAAGYRFAAKWIVGSEECVASTEFPAIPLNRDLPAVRQARRMFRGNDAAVALSTSLSELRLLSLPLTDGSELRAMAAEELLADQENEAAINTDVWSIDRTPRQDSSIRVMAAGMLSEVADRVGHDLRSAGYAPRALDVAPCAMARAVAIANPSTAAVTTAALDLSYSSALLTIALDGKPTFCRTLRDCGLRTILQPLSDRLGASLRECRQIITRSGVPDDFDAANRQHDLAYPLLAPGLERLAEELNRTFAFIRQELPLHRPERICVFGGGALIKNLAGFLSHRCGLPTAAWSLNGGEPHDPLEPLFGIAAGLSSIAWEG